MYAIVGLPGSQYHSWGHYYRGSEDNLAQEWAERTRDQILRDNPVVGSLPIQHVSDREAEGRRWQDGRRIYSRGDGESEIRDYLDNRGRLIYHP